MTVKKLLLSATLCAALVAAILVVNGCSGEENASDKENVFKDQTRAIDKAKKVEDLLQGSDKKRRQTLEKQSK